MGSRLNLQALLESITPNVYFQPPPSFEMTYPCIRYERDYIKTEFADNIPYATAKRYKVMAISDDPDSTIPDQLLQLPQSAFDRHYTADGLNHDVFIIYY